MLGDSSEERQFKKEQFINNELKGIILSEGGVSLNYNENIKENCEISSSDLAIKTFKKIWIDTLATLATETDKQIYSAYLNPLKFIEYSETENLLRIGAPSKFVTIQVERTFKEKLIHYFSERLFSNYLSNDPNAHRTQVNISFIIEVLKEEELNPYIVVKKAKNHSDQNPLKSNPQGVNYIVENYVNKRYLFENFVVGNSNQFCHAASLRVAEEPGKSYNPLFIYGGVGLGKTHLLHAIGNEALRKNPKSNVLYISSEAFTNELIHALRHSKMEEFKQKFRNLHVLLIDDIQFIVGKERTQEEFFHTFNALYEAKHQIVITSDKMPSEIPGIEERLQTRFSWGLMADLQAPDFETRVAIVKRKASLENILIPEEVCHLIAQSISSNVRELEGALTRISALSSLNKVEITLQSAEEMLKPIIQPKVMRITVEDIKKAVSDYFDIKTSDIISKRRTRNLSFPRQIAMYLCRKHTTASYPDIGEQFGGRDHSSVIHSANVVTAKAKTDQEVKQAIEVIETRILGL